MFIARKERREENMQRSHRRTVDTWMNPEALWEEGRNQRRREDGKKSPYFLSAVPSYGCVYVCVCVRAAHMCNRAGGVEQGAIPDGHTHQ